MFQGPSFYRSLWSKQKPLSSVLMGCPCASQGRETWERRGEEVGEEAAPTPFPKKKQFSRGKWLAFGGTFQLSLDLGSRLDLCFYPHSVDLGG